jgi:diguanylate cyclase (GGDEF)-like protein/PAS domain S-box-containing protein
VTWKRIPHQFVLAFIFSVIAFGLAAAIIRGSATTLRQADDSIAYATTEIRGTQYLAGTQRVLHDLLGYRAGLVAGRLRPEDDAAWITRISASLAAIRDRSAPDTPLDDAIAAQLAELNKRWSLTRARTSITPPNVSDVIAAAPQLVNDICNASGLTNDPSIDGINFADVAIRVPLSLAYGSQSASLAAENLVAHDRSLRARFSAARLLAQAQVAIDVGVQDAQDIVAADPGAGASLTRATAANKHDFETLTNRVTSLYVETGTQRPGRVFDPALIGELETFTASSFAILTIVHQNLTHITSARIAQSRMERRHVQLATLGEVSFELFVMLSLAWISIVSDRNQRRRTAAERMVLESQRTGLEAQLTQARAQQALLLAQAQFRAVFDGAPTGMIIVDSRCTVLETNEAARAMLPEADQAMTVGQVVLDHAAGIEQILMGAAELYSQEREYANAGNRSRWFHVSISPVHDESGTALVAILMLRDVTESKSMEAQLVFEAGHDALTGLPNRKLFLTLLQQALDERSRAYPPDTFSVVFIDFNDFKTINDSFGHQAGDKFLIDGAARLQAAVRSTDVVARIGGDEFALMLHSSDRSDIESSVTRLQSVVSLPVNIEGQLVTSSASFGIAQADARYTLATEIIRDADTAMYQAKAQGGRKFVVFDLSMRERVVHRMQLSIDIVHALDHNEMELWYQPIVDLNDGTIAGCEALVRWRRADGSIISPTEFMPLAEENGSIIEIGRWVTATACEQLRAWSELARRGGLPGMHDDFVMHINLAVPEVHHVGLLSSLKQTLLRTSVSRDQVMLEITEGIVLTNTAHTRATLDGLTQDGFRLCIDDFGTGYSSLRYLNELPLHSFKIDRSFVSNGGDGLANESIVEMLMVLSRSLELSVVSEGIETLTQWKQLRGHGCRYGQGYLFSPAVDGTHFTDFLERDVALSRLPQLEPVVQVAP